MKKRTTVLLGLICALTLVASFSCGGKGPTEPTTGRSVSPATSAGEDEGASAMALSTMRWSLADRCPDGRGLQWRLFDIVNNTRYPTIGTYRTASGFVASKSISCTTGHKICIGGTTVPASTLTFGVGINGTRRTAAVLRSVACRACGTVVQRLALFCAGANGFGEGDSGLEEDFGFSGFSEEESGEADALTVE